MNKVLILLLLALVAVQINAAPSDAKDAKKDAGKDAKDAAKKAGAAAKDAGDKAAADAKKAGAGDAAKPCDKKKNPVVSAITGFVDDCDKEFDGWMDMLF